MASIRHLLRSGLGTRLGARLGAQIPCRGCLGPLDLHAEAGLCGRCWEGLIPLPDDRCPRCALPHDLDKDCPEPTAWETGDALWQYHGGRPALGALLLPGIKSGELGWRHALLRRASAIALPEFIQDADLVTSAPTAFHRRLLRGFDLAEDFARGIAQSIQKPFTPTLRRARAFRRQAMRTESERRRLPQRAIAVLKPETIYERSILLVDDVWTTGTTLLRCAQALRGAGAREVRVLTLFRAL
jgi:predicted amidophosphoribosyltransferase